MAVINSRTRYRATSEQQKLLQRNISSQAEFARLTTERANIRARQDTLDKLTSLGAVPRLTMDSFIEHTMTLVEHLLG